MIFPGLERIFLFLDKMQKAQILNEKTAKLDQLKFKTAWKYMSKNKVKNQVIDWKKISVPQIMNKGLASRRIRKFLEISKRQVATVLEWAKDKNKHFLRRDWPTN